MLEVLDDCVEKCFLNAVNHSSAYRNVQTSVFQSEHKSSRLCHQSKETLCLIGSCSFPWYLLSPATLGRTNGEQRIAAESLKIEINLSARHKWGDNIIIAPWASCFCFSICIFFFISPGRSHMVDCLCTWLCVCGREQETQKIPLRGIYVLVCWLFTFLCGAAKLA